MKRNLQLLALIMGGTFSMSATDSNFRMIDYPNATSTQTWGINARGDIVGFYVAADKTSHGFLYNGGHFTAINYPGAAVTLVNGVNARGDLVGEYGATATSSHRGFLLSTDGVFTPIDYPRATYTSGIGIDARGNVLGAYTLADNVNHGFLLSEGHFTSIDYPGADGTAVNGISPQGDIVGGYSIGSVSHGFLFSSGAYTSFDYPSAAFTTATGANAAGTIVGRYRDAGGVNHGFVLNNGTFTNFDYPSATFTGATSIDTAGNILGRCTVAGATHGFLMASAAQPGRYMITDLGVVGAPPGQGFFVTPNHLVAGAATVAGGQTHAVLWARGAMTDLGVPGLNSMAFSVNENATAVGGAETSTLDPHGEDFCGFKAMGVPTNGSECVPFASRYGAMTPLRTLGGYNGVANMINTRGQIAGEAENATIDPSCPSPQVYQFKPVLWQSGDVEELPTAGGDPNGVALAINQAGQIVGASGACATFSQTLLVNLQPLHALLWEAGKVIDLGSLGGTGHGNGIVALNLNNLGEVVGASDLAGDKVSHAFLWTRLTGMQDLGTLDGDVISAALAINDSGVITGVSLDADFNLRAFVRRDGVMTDVNTLIPANSPLYLLLACSINAAGEITGLAVNPDTGDLHAYVATPATGGM
jgi:probable HAF family extracellular repeat protein